MKTTPAQIRAAAERHAESDFLRLVIEGHAPEDARRAVDRQLPAQVEIYRAALAA